MDVSRRVFEREHQYCQWAIRSSVICRSPVRKAVPVAGCGTARRRRPGHRCSAALEDGSTTCLVAPRSAPRGRVDLRHRRIQRAANADRRVTSTYQARPYPPFEPDRARHAPCSTANDISLGRRSTNSRHHAHRRAAPLPVRQRPSAIAFAPLSRPTSVRRAGSTLSTAAGRRHLSPPAAPRVPLRGGPVSFTSPPGKARQGHPHLGARLRAVPPQINRFEGDDVDVLRSPPTIDGVRIRKNIRAEPDR